MTYIVQQIHPLFDQQKSQDIENLIFDVINQ